MENKIVVLGGGCFWCTDAIFREVKGVQTVKAGFSGGFIKNPAYREVRTGRTGHAEVIQITYDPKQVSYEELLRIHLLTHDPTTLNEQGADKGTQYRSIIFYTDETEKAIAAQVLQEIQPEFDAPIVTLLQPFDVFYEAEDVHQNYYNDNIDAFYCEVVISPKLDKFRKLILSK